MSLLDLAEQLLGSRAQGGNAALLQTVLSMVNNHPGGLPGLVQSFEQQGLGGVGPILGWERTEPAGER